MGYFLFYPLSTYKSFYGQQNYLNAIVISSFGQQCQEKKRLKKKEFCYISLDEILPKDHKETKTQNCITAGQKVRGRERKKNGVSVMRVVPISGLVNVHGPVISRVNNCRLDPSRRGGNQTRFPLLFPFPYKTSRKSTKREGDGQGSSSSLYHYCPPSSVMLWQSDDDACRKLPIPLLNSSWSIRFSHRATDHRLTAGQLVPVSKSLFGGHLEAGTRNKDRERERERRRPCTVSFIPRLFRENDRTKDGFPTPTLISLLHNARCWNL